jgi:hypothetical protein
MVERRHGELVVKGPDQPLGLPAAVGRWYGREAASFLPERVVHFAECLGEAAPHIAVTGAGSYWGRCSWETGLRFNWRVMKLAPHLVDYVVAHEVAHLRHLNHGSRFWQTVGRLCPDYESAREEVKRCTPECFVF